MKHSDYLFTPCKACGEEFPGTSREQDTRPAAEVWERRSRHWRKAALELQKQRDALLDAAKNVAGWIHGEHDRDGKLPRDTYFQEAFADYVETLDAAIKLAEGEANGS